MSSLIRLLALVTVFFALNAHAGPGIKRIDPELTDTSNEVAMAIETYDGDFYDISEIMEQRKYKGNAQDILKQASLKLKNGDEITTNAIRYFFIEKKLNKIEIAGKRPNDEE